MIYAVAQNSKKIQEERQRWTHEREELMKKKQEEEKVRAQRQHAKTANRSLKKTSSLKVKIIFNGLAVHGTPDLILNLTLL
jgi:hypothetical protein